MALDLGPAVAAHQPLVLARLPPDLLLLIAAHLDPPDLAALSATSKHILDFVDNLAWRSYVQLQRRYTLLDRSASIPSPAPPMPPTSSADPPISSGLLPRSVWWYRARFFLAVRRAHAQKVLYAYQTHLPVPQDELRPQAQPHLNRPAQPSDFHRSAKLAFAMPYLLVGTRRIVVAMRSDLYLFERKVLNHPNAMAVPLDFGRCRLLHLNSHATPGRVPQGARPGPWQDITAICKLDESCDSMLVGFADGTLQKVEIRTKPNKGGGGRPKLAAHVVETISSPYRQEIADVSAATHSLARSDGSKVQETLMASISKRGSLQVISLCALRAEDGGGAKNVKLIEEWQIDHKGQPLHRPSSVRAGTSASASDDEASSGVATNAARRFRSPAFNNASAMAPAVGAQRTRAWCVQLGGDVGATADQRWIAVGMTGDLALFIYPLTGRSSTIGGSGGRNGIELGEPWSLTSSGRRTSVLALATPPRTSRLPGHLVFAGFYDGWVRVYDTRALFAPASGSRQTSSRAEQQGGERRLRPIAEFSDTFDDTSVYSLAFGGVDGCKLLAGNSVHARVRVWDVAWLASDSLSYGTVAPPSLPPQPPLLEGLDNGEHEDEEEERKEPPVDRGKTTADWSVFAAYPSKSPQYSIGADFDRVWGVTDRTIWVLDFGAPALVFSLDPHSTDREGAKEEENQPEPQLEGAGKRTVAYFNHVDGSLKTSRTSF
ncbi:hypothetical protein ACQY0O_001299 [Thecaphora frezii]